MAGFKVMVLLIVFQIVDSKPLLFKEFHIQRNFDLSFTPPHFKPLVHGEFIKEIRTKLGHIITKHTIAKRSPDSEPVDSPPTIFLVSLEKSMDAGAPPLLPPPPPPPLEDVGVTPLPPMFISSSTEMVTPGPRISVPPISSPPPIYISEDLSRLPVGTIEEVFVITPAPPPPPPPVIVPTPILPAVAESPVRESPPPAPLPPPPPPRAVVPADLLVQGNLLTDIGRVDEINAYLKAVQALMPPPAEPPADPVLPVVSNSIEEPHKPVAEDKLSPLMKGSRLALYFGNILLQVMSGVISSARSAISQYSQPAPI